MKLYYFWPLTLLGLKAQSITIRITRKWQTEISTIGKFTIDDSDIKGFILEEKGPDTTVSGLEQRIPIGIYNLAWHYGHYFQGVLKLYNENVPKSRSILIHKGNDAEDTRGCLLPGINRMKDRVYPSRPMFNAIINKVKEIGIEGARIIISEEYENV